MTKSQAAAIAEILRKDDFPEVVSPKHAHDECILRFRDKPARPRCRTAFFLGSQKRSRRGTSREFERQGAKRVSVTGPFGAGCAAETDRRDKQRICQRFRMSPHRILAMLFGHVSRRGNENRWNDSSHRVRPAKGLGMRRFISLQAAGASAPDRAADGTLHACKSRHCAGPGNGGMSGGGGQWKLAKFTLLFIRVQIRRPFTIRSARPSRKP